MADASRDDNRIPTLLGVDHTDETTPLKAEITETTGRLRVDVLITGDDATTTDVDDDNIAKAQVLPLKIVEPYVFSKGDDAWIRTQGSTDGYPFVRPIGVFDSAGHEVDINTSGQIETAPYGEHDRYGQDAVTEAMITIEHPHHEIHTGNHYYMEGYATLGNDASLRVKLVTPNTTKWGHFLWNIASSTILDTQLYEGASGGMGSGSRAVIHANNRNSNCWTGSHTGGNDEATVLTDSAQTWTVDALIGLQVFNETDKSSAIITDNTATTVTVAALAGGTGNDWDTNDRYEINNSQMVVESGVDAATVAGTLISGASWGSRGLGGNQTRDDELILKQNTTYYRVFHSGAASNVVSFKASWYEHVSLN